MNVTEELTPTAERLADRLVAVGRRRVRLDEIWACFLDAAPDAVTAADKRERLAAALNELADAAVIALPRSRRSYDSRAQLPLPRFVKLASGEAPPTEPASPFPWRAELAWATSMRLTEQQRSDLERINSWLRDGCAEGPVVPLRERSLEILGREKGMEELARSALFGPGRLTWELLRCRPYSPPFVWVGVGDSPVLLVVENHHTFHSLVRVAREGPGAGHAGAVGMVAYGAGNHFAGSVRYAAELDRHVERIVYFGDVDRGGLRTPLRASVAASDVGLPAVEPAAGLYRRLFETGRPTTSVTRCPAAEAAELAAWLPADLRTRAVELLTSGQRLAQEWVGYDVLRRTGVGL